MDGALDYIFGALSIVLSVMGLIIILGFRRDRLVQSFIEAVTAEAFLLSQREGDDPSDDVALAYILLVRRVPDERWGWWRRRWRELHTFPPWRMKHYRFVLLVRRPDATYYVVLLWESQLTRREAINVALTTYDYDALAAEHSVDDEDCHAIVPLDGGHYLIAEPALRWPRNRKARVRSRTGASTGAASEANANLNRGSSGSRSGATTSKEH